MLSKIRNDNAVMQLLIYVLLVMLFLIENNVLTGKYNIHSTLDDFIPFIPIFVVPYFAWYFFIVKTAVDFFNKSKEDFIKTFMSINLCMVIGMIIYLVFPNYQSLRPEFYTEDFFSQWVKLLQIADSPVSVCPSLHVAVSISLYNGVTHSSCYKNMPDVKFFTFVLTALICMSTVFIKQHSVIDVAAGIILGAAVYIFVYKIHFREKLETILELDE